MRTENGEKIVSYNPLGMMGTNEPHQLKGLINVFRLITMLVSNGRLSSTNTMLRSSSTAVSSLQKVRWLNMESRVGKNQ